MRRQLIDRAPIAALTESLAERERAARELPGADVAARLLAEIRRDLESAIADAERPPEDGVSVEEEAAREGLTKWAVYKRRQRAARDAA
jgi:hypothetical protein